MFIAISQQPDEKYLIFNWDTYKIISFNLDEEQLFKDMKEIYDGFPGFERRIAEAKENFDRDKEENKWWPSWNTVIYHIFLGHGKDVEGNHDKLLTVLERGLITETDLSCMYKRWKLNQIPLLKRKIIPFATLKTPIEDMELPVRFENYLTNLIGVKTVGELIRYSEQDLKKKRFIGPRGIKEIKEGLWQYRLTLKSENAWPRPR